MKKIESLHKSVKTKEARIMPEGVILVLEAGEGIGKWFLT